MHLNKTVYNIGFINYFRVIFFGRKFLISYAVSDQESASSLDREYAIAPSEKGMLSLSKTHLLLTYLNQLEGKRYPVYVKACKYLGQEKSMFRDSDEDVRSYQDQDGWTWEVDIYPSDRQRTMGRGAVNVSDEDGNALFTLFLE